MWVLLSVILNTCDCFGLCLVLLFTGSSGFDLVICYWFTICGFFDSVLVGGWGWSLFSCWLCYVCCWDGVWGYAFGSGCCLWLLLVASFSVVDCCGLVYIRLYYGVKLVWGRGFVLILFKGLV